MKPHLSTVLTVMPPAALAVVVSTGGQRRVSVVRVNLLLAGGGVFAEQRAERLQRVRLPPLWVSLLLLLLLLAISLRKRWWFASLGAGVGLTLGLARSARARPGGGEWCAPALSFPPRFPPASASFERFAAPEQQPPP